MLWALRVLIVYFFTPIKDSKDLAQRVAIGLVGAILLFAYIQYDKTNRNRPIEEFEIIEGRLSDKGKYDNRKYGRGYFIRIQNNTGTYKLTVSDHFADRNFLSRIGETGTVKAWVRRSSGGIELVELELNGRKVLRRHNGNYSRPNAT